MTDDLHRLEITELAHQIQKREISPVQITEYMLDRIARLDPHLHAFSHVTAELAIQQANDAQAR